jgi:hypothetical protein
MFERLFGKKDSDSTGFAPKARRSGWRTFVRVLIIILVFLLTIRLGWGWKAGRDVDRAIDSANKAGAPMRVTDVPLPAVPPDDDAWPIFKEMLDKASAAGVGMAAVLEYQAQSAPLTQAQEAMLKQDKQDEELLKAWTVTQPMSAELIEKFRPRLAAHAELLAMLKNAAEKPAIRWRVTDEPMRPVDADFPPLQLLLRMVEAQAAIDYQTGNTDDALANLTAVLRCARLARQAPMLDVLAMEAAATTDACDLLQVWLPTLKATPEQTAPLRSALEDSSSQTAVHRAAVLRRAWLHAIYLTTFQAEGIGEQVRFWLARPFVDASYANSLNLFGLTIPLLEQPYAKMAGPMKQLWGRYANPGSTEQWAKASLFWVRLAADRQALGESERRMASIGLAARAYQLAHGELPPTLEALSPEFLESVPTDPMTDKPFGYLPHAAYPRLYSVGLDLADNVGAWDAAKDPVGQEGHDVCFFLAGVPAEPQTSALTTTQPATAESATTRESAAPIATSPPAATEPATPTGHATSTSRP